MTQRLMQGQIQVTNDLTPCKLVVDQKYNKKKTEERKKTSHASKERVNSNKLASSPRYRKPVEFGSDCQYLTLNGTDIKNITELDVSNNGITSLEVTSLAALTSLNCSNNAIITISVHGFTLLSLIADKNRVTSIRVKKQPRRLRQLVVSRNSLSSVPTWLVSCCRLEYCDVSRNAISSLPSYVTSGHLSNLRVLNANYNRLAALSSTEEDSLSAYERNRTCALEVLSVHHNRLRNIPYNFFQTFNRLRILNASSNFIQKLPLHAEDVGRPSLQELFVADNRLDELESIEICQNLRVLHAPFNQISSIEESLFWSCENLEELVISGNRLRTLPPSVARLRSLEVLRVHLNPIQSLPRLSHLGNLKVVDASHCRLGKLDFSSIVSASLTSLDVAFNPSLKVDRQQFFKCRSERFVDVVDTAGEKDRILPFQEVETGHHDLPGVLHHRGSNEAESCQREEEAAPFSTQIKSDSKTAAKTWKIGFSETIGKRESSLTTAQLRISDLGDGRTGLVAMADGGESVTVAEKLLRSFPEALQEEKSSSPDLNDALRFALLSSLRNVLLDQKTIPVGFCSASLELGWKKVDHFGARSSVHRLTADRGGGGTVRFCCFGGVKAVVTSTDGPPQVIEDSNRLELNEKDGGELERNSQCAGNHFGSSRLPNPQTKLIRLAYPHQTLIIGSSSLWDILEPEEASEICHDAGDPSLAAKRLLTLAQSYGSKKSLSVLIVSFSCNSRRNLYQYSSLSTKISPTYKDLSLKVSDLNMNCNGIGTSRNSSKNGIKSFPDMNSGGNVELEEIDRYPPSGQSDSDESSTEARHDTQEILFPDIQECLLTDQQAGQLSKYVNWRSSLHDLTAFRCEEKLQGTEKDRHESDESPLQLITPPAAFADSGDSRFSRNSESVISKYPSEPCSKDMNHTSQVTMELFRNWENVIDRNSKNIYLQELNSLTRGKQNNTSASLQNLSQESKNEFETNLSRKEPHSPVNNQTHLERNPFERGLFRKSKFAKGATTFFHHKFNFGTAHKISKFSKLLCKTENFRRFGSLQNLKHYQSSKSRSFSSPNVTQMSWSETVGNEMKEKSKLDSTEVETRIDHYWNAGVTCF